MKKKKEKKNRLSIKIRIKKIKKDHKPLRKILIYDQ
jgi:hypothetical protein